MLSFYSIVFGLPFFLNEMIDFLYAYVERLFPLSLMSWGLAQTVNLSDLLHRQVQKKTSDIPESNHFN